MAHIDLSNVPLADNHCHGIYQTQALADLTTWRRLFTESFDPAMQSTHVATTLFYRRLIREMAAFFECEPTEEAVLACCRMRRSVIWQTAVWRLCYGWSF